MTWNRNRKSSRANALVEYALPILVILGIIGALTTLNFKDLIGNYFITASGHTKVTLKDGTFKPKALGSKAKGLYSNGGQGFHDSNMGELTDGDGSIIEVSGSNGQDMTIQPVPIGRTPYSNDPGLGGCSVIDDPKKDGKTPISPTPGIPGQTKPISCEVSKPDTRPTEL